MLLSLEEAGMIFYKVLFLNMKSPTYLNFQIRTFVIRNLLNIFVVSLECYKHVIFSSKIKFIQTICESLPVSLLLYCFCNPLIN